MSRSDEFTEEGPRRSWQSPRDRDDRDRDDRDLHRDRGDGLRIDRPHRSGAVMSVGILGIVLGSLALMCGMCGGVGSVALLGCLPILQPELKQQAQFDANAAKMAQDLDKVQSLIWLPITESVLNLGLGITVLLCSIGVLLRSNYARFGLLAIMVIWIFVEFADIITKLVLGLFTNVPEGLESAAILLVVIAFALYAGIILMIPKFAADFHH
jgi:hypothetical protein